MAAVAPSAAGKEQERPQRGRRRQGGRGGGKRREGRRGRKRAPSRLPGCPAMPPPPADRGLPAPAGSHWSSWGHHAPQRGRAAPPDDAEGAQLGALVGAAAVGMIKVVGSCRLPGRYDDGLSGGWCTRHGSPSSLDWNSILPPFETNFNSTFGATPTMPSAPALLQPAAPPT